MATDPKLEELRGLAWSIPRKLKEKYPEAYGNVPDNVLLQKIAQKYPKAYGKAAEIAFGTIEKTPYTFGTEVSQLPLRLKHSNEYRKKHKEFYVDLAKKYGGIAHIPRDIAEKKAKEMEQLLLPPSRKAPEGTVASGIEQGIDKFLGFAEKHIDPKIKKIDEELWRTIDRPFGAIRNLAAGKSPLQGFLRPDDTPKFGSSVVTAWGIKDENTAMVVGGLVGTALDIGSFYLVFNAAPKGLKELKAAAIKPYNAAQLKEINALKAALKHEFNVAGFSNAESQKIVNDEVAKRWARTGIFKQTPRSIRVVTNEINKNKGKLGNFMKEQAAKAKDTAAKSGFTKEWMDKATDTHVKRLTNQQRLLTDKTIRLGPPTAEAKLTIKPRGVKPKPVSSKIERTAQPEAKPTPTLPELQAAKEPKIETPPSEAPIEDIFQVEIQTLEGAVATNMTGSQLEQLKKDIALSRKGGPPARHNKVPVEKVIDSYKIGNNEAGFVRFSGELKGLQELKDKFLKMVSVEAPFKKAEGPLTGIEVKTYLSKRAAGEEKTLQHILKLGNFKLKPSDFNTLAFASEELSRISLADQERLKPAIEYIRKYFDDYWKVLKEKMPGAFDQPWPQSKVLRNKEELSHLADSIKSAHGKRLEKIVARVRELKAENKFFEDHNIKYVHLPVKLWLASQWEKDPAKTRQIISGMFKAIRGRETPTLIDFINAGLINSKDVDIRDIMANYGRYVEGQLAQLDIINSAKAEGLVKPTGADGTEAWSHIPMRLAPGLKGYVAHPQFAAALEEYFTSLSAAPNAVSRVLGAVKMMQFYNPVILPMYDIWQAFNAGTINIKLPIHAAQALNDVIQKTPEYWIAAQYAFSTPFANPFEKYMQMVKDIKTHQDNAGNYLMDALGKLKEYAGAPHKVIKDIYNASWHTAWFLDHYIRMTTTRYFMGTGLPIKEAAQLAARFHGDYASIPPKTRKVLNKLFFTPTFEAVMNKVYVEMIASAGKVVLKGGKGTPREKIMARGLVYVAASLVGKHAVMTKALRMKSQEPSRRYYAEVEMPEGPKEVVVVFSNPNNIWQRYYYGLKPDEYATNIFERFTRFGMGKLNPLWRTGIMLGTNKDETGRPIYNIFDPPHVFVGDMIKFTGTRLVRLFGEIGNLRGDQYTKHQAAQSLNKSIGTFRSAVIRKIAYVYTRQIKDERFDAAFNSYERAFNMAVGNEREEEEAYRSGKMDEYVDKMRMRYNIFRRKSQRIYDKYMEER